MRRFTSIFLTVIFVLYHLGYYGIYLVAKHAVDEEWTERIIKSDHENQDLEQVSIPLTLPYQPSFEDFRTVNESIKIDGEYYRVIEQSYERDTLHVVYAADSQVTMLSKVFEAWINSFADNPATDMNFFSWNKSFGKYFLCSELPNLNLFFKNTASKLNTISPSTVLSPYISVPTPPPKA